jgi:hypothetical protein
MAELLEVTVIEWPWIPSLGVNLPLLGGPS